MDTMRKPLWVRYKNHLNIKHDLKEIFFRPHDRHAVLDGARGLTILLMVLFHCVYGVVTLFGDKVDLFVKSYPDYLDWTWHIQGSDPLFVMCGLLVSYSLFREHNKNNRINVTYFYKNRLMRILPLFLFAIVLYLPTDDDNILFLLSNLTFTSNFFPGHTQIIPVGWSLAVQMQFYLILPFIVALLFATRWRLLTLSLMIVGSIYIRYYVTLSDPLIYEIPFFNILYDNDFGALLSDALYYDIEDRIGSFLIGVAVAYIHTYHCDKLTQFLKKHVLINFFLLVLAAAMILIPLFIPAHDRFSFFYKDFDTTVNFWYLVMNRYVYSMGIGLLILLALCPAGLSLGVKRFFALPIWHPFAQLIFPIYLFHFPFIALGAAITFWSVDKTAVLDIQTYQVFVVYFLAVLFTVLFSTLLHLYLEKPFLSMRNKKP